MWGTALRELQALYPLHACREFLRALPLFGFAPDRVPQLQAVSEVLEIPGSEIEPPPAFGAKIRADFIAGMGKVSGKFVILLDIQRVLSVEEMAHLATVGGTTNAEAVAETH